MGKLYYLETDYLSQISLIDTELNTVQNIASHQKTWTDDLITKKYILEAEKEFLTANYNTNKTILEESRFIQSNNNLSLFYSTLMEMLANFLNKKVV